MYGGIKCVIYFLPLMNGFFCSDMRFAIYTGAVGRNGCTCVKCRLLLPDVKKVYKINGCTIFVKLCNIRFRKNPFDNYFTCYTRKDK